MPRRSRPLLELARHGAEVRYRELVDEAKHLLGLFPHLSDAIDRDELPLPFLIAEGARTPSPAQPSSRRTRAAAAGRGAVRERAKKSWAARRKAKKT
jgi:hypothetical protein